MQKLMARNIALPKYEKNPIKKILPYFNSICENESTGALHHIPSMPPKMQWPDDFRDAIVLSNRQLVIGRIDIGAFTVIVLLDIT